MKTKYSLEEIKEVIPHREPFIFIDEILNFKDNEGVVALKRVQPDDWYFAGHFPQKPVMPGVLILEALAQAGCFFCLNSSLGAEKGSILYLTKCEEVKWISQVTPPTDLILEVKFVDKKMNFWFMDAMATVNNKKVCTAKITAYSEKPN